MKTFFVFIGLLQPIHVCDSNDGKFLGYLIYGPNYGTGLVYRWVWSNHFPANGNIIYLDRPISSEQNAHVLYVAKKCKALL